MESADSELMLRVRDGDLSKLSPLFDRHHRRLFRFFVRLSGDREASEDLVQEVFLRLLKYRHTYGADDRFSAWLYRIARNAYLDGLSRRDGAEKRDAIEEAPSPEPGIEERLGRGEQIDLLRRALRALPLEKREVLVLSRYQNLKYEEIAAVLNCETGAVKVRVYRALRELGRIYFRLAGERAS